MAITREEALQLLGQSDQPTITPEEAQRLLAQDANQAPAINNQINSSTAQQLAQQSLDKTSMLLSGLFGARKGLKDLGNNALQLMGRQPAQYAEASPVEKAVTQYAPASNQAGYIGGQTLPIARLPLGIASAAARYGTLPKMLGQATEGAMIAPLYNPNDIADSMGIGAGIGLAVTPTEKILNSFMKGLGSFLKLGGRNSAEKVIKNEEALKTLGIDEKMPLGEVINSPTLTSLQSILAKVPGSKQASNYMDVGEAIENTTENVLKGLAAPKIDSKGHPIDVNDLLVGKLKETRDFAKTTSNALYEDVRKAADSNDRKINPLEYSKTAKNELENLTKYSKENESWNDIYDPSLISRLSKEVNKGELSYGAAFDLDRRLNDAIFSAADKKDRPTLRVLRNLKSAINEDIDKSALESGDEKLVNAWKKAKGHYKEVIVPLHKKLINQFIEGDKRSEDIIPAFLKGGQFEKPRLLGNFTRYLSPEEKGYIAHEFLTKGMREVQGETEIEPGKVLNAYEKMGDSVKKMLFNPEQRKQLDAALTAKKMVGLNLNQMINPKTGALNAQISAWLSAIGSGGALPLAANLTTRAIKSPKLRNFYLSQAKKAPIKDIQLDPAYRVLLPLLGAFQGSSSKTGENK